MIAALRTFAVGLGQILLLAVGAIVCLFDAGAAVDDQVRAEFAPPRSWPIWAVTILVLSIAISAAWPWGFAQ